MKVVDVEWWRYGKMNPRDMSSTILRIPDPYCALASLFGEA